MSVSDNQILELYTAMFNRVADHDGLEYWKNEVNLHNWTIEDIANSFSEQIEYKELYNSTDYNYFITSIYENLLNREPDDSGLNYWVNELENGNITESSAVLAIINGAKANSSEQSMMDVKLINNKTALSQYFSTTLQRNDTDVAQNAFELVGDTTESLNSALDRLAEDTQTDKITSHLNLEFTDNIPIEDQKVLQEDIDAVMQMYSLSTGFSIEKDITIDNDDNNPVVGWVGNFDYWNLDKLPSEDPNFDSFLLFEYAHLYYEYSLSDTNILEYPDDINLRPEEMIGQGLSTISYAQYGYLLDVNDSVDKITSMPMDPKFQEAFDNLMDSVNLYSIYQYDVNQNIQVQTINAAKLDFVKLYDLDNNFFNNFLGEDKIKYSNYEEYKELFIDAITTVPRDEAEEFVNNLDYFRQIDEKETRPDYVIEIALFSSTDFPDLPINQQYMYEHPTSFRIFGQSNNIDDYDGVPIWDRVPDPDFYSQKATVDIVDDYGNIVWHSDDVPISINFASSSQNLLYMNLIENEHYTINAEVDINGIELTDSLDFVYLV